ncbi:hypothetical protein HC776_02220 [bacterium]|nr:hypothetical protein [bacterium]
MMLAAWGEGFDVVILEQRGDWARVMRADGATGWVDRRVVGLVTLPNGD